MSALEAELGIPVVSSDKVLAWYMAQATDAPRRESCLSRPRRVPSQHFQAQAAVHDALDLAAQLLECGHWRAISDRDGHHRVP